MNRPFAERIAHFHSGQLAELAVAGGNLSARIAERIAQYQIDVYRCTCSMDYEGAEAFILEYEEALITAWEGRIKEILSTHRTERFH